MAERDEKFAEDFKKKGLYDDNYPFSYEGIKALERTISVGTSTFFYWLIGLPFGKLLLFLLSIMDKGIQKGMVKTEQVSNSGLSALDNYYGKAPHAPISFGNIIKFDIIESISKWGTLIFDFVGKVLIVLTIFMIARYAYYTVRRHLCWETRVLRNDIEALRLKRLYLKQTNSVKIHEELKKRIKKDRKKDNADGGFERSNKDDVAMARIKAHLKMTVYVNTRKAQNSMSLQKQYRAVFKMPMLQEAVKQITTDLKDVDVAFRTLLKGEVTFGKTETTQDYGFKVSRGVILEKKQLESTRSKAKVRVAGAKGEYLKDSEWAKIPLSVYMDRTQVINETKVIAKASSEKMAQKLKTYFVSVQSNLTLSDISLNAKNAIYHFVLPQYSPQMPEALTLEKNLQSMLGEPSLTVSVSGGVDITVPLPKKQELPLNTASVFREAFGKGNFSVTDVVAGVKGDGKPLILNFAKLPHMIIAGTTGSGKSVAINAMIHSIMLKADPSQIKFAMVDPKKVEFVPYENNPYLFSPIVQTMENAYALLTFLADDEMDRRYDLFARFKGVKNLEDFNSLLDNAKQAGIVFKKYSIVSLADYKASKEKEVRAIKSSIAKTIFAQPDILSIEKMPYLITVVDEYADMGNMLEKKGAKVKASMNANFQRLGQKARAAGIHVWLATQRPSIQVISGDIKANFPSRYALRVGTETDSGVVLDQSGAEKLLGNGDGLIKDESGKVTRTQALFIDDKGGEGELTKFMDALKHRFGEPVYENYLQKMVDKGIVEWKKGKEGEEVDIVTKGSIFG